MKKDEIVTINGKKYRKLKTIWNGNLDWNNPLLDICHSDDWIMINGVEYEELKGGDLSLLCQIQ